MMKLSLGDEQRIQPTAELEHAEKRAILCSSQPTPTAMSSSKDQHLPDGQSI
jgi:hypothetical protein